MKLNVMIYRCRRCHQRFELRLESNPSPLLAQVSFHACFPDASDGTSGVGDLIGFREVEVELTEQEQRVRVAEANRRELEAANHVQCGHCLRGFGSMEEYERHSCSRNRSKG